jgi:hypothetical protein
MNTRFNNQTFGEALVNAPTPSEAEPSKFTEQGIRARGLTNYPTLCGLAGQAGVDKWTCDLLAMTCNYFDRSGRELHVESIPTGGYEKSDSNCNASKGEI